MPSNKSVIVVGAGLSGLACAYKLKQRGLEVMLLDAGRKPGGLIGSVTTDGFVFESGPQSFQLTDTLAALVRELKLESALQTADSKAPRYVLKHGQLEQIPMSPQAMLTSQFLSLGSRFKIASEPFRRSKPPVEEESVAAFVRRNHRFAHGRIGKNEHLDPQRFLGLGDCFQEFFWRIIRQDNQMSRHFRTVSLSRRPALREARPPRAPGAGIHATMNR